MPPSRQKARQAGKKNSRSGANDAARRDDADGLRAIVMSHCGLLVFVVALAARLIFAYQHADNPSFDQLIVDAQLYDATARAFVKTGEMGFGFFWQPFFHPLALSIIYACTNCSVLAARVVQLVVGAATCALTYHLGRRVFDKRVGLIAGLIVALHGPLIFFECELVGAVWAAFWSVVMLHAALSAERRGTLLSWLLAGICGGMCVIARPSFLPVVLAVAAYLGVVSLRRRASWTTATGRVGAGVAGFLLVALPVMFVSKSVTGSYSLLPTSGGLNVYIGNNENRAHTLTIRPGDEWTEFQRMSIREGYDSPRERSEFFYRKTREFALSQPAMFVRGMFDKALQFLNGREVPRNTDVYVFREWSSLLSLLTWKVGGFGFPWTPLLLLTVIGLVLRWRDIPVPLVLLLLIYPLAIVLVFVSARYRVPLVPAMSVVAGAGAIALVEHIRSGRRVAPAVATVIALAVVVVSMLPAPAPEERVDYAAEMFVLVADEAHGTDRDRAIRWYEEALRREPSCRRAHSHLASVLAAGTTPEERRGALRHFDLALEADGTLFSKARVHYERALVFMKGNANGAALRDLDAALELYPELTAALCRRGLIYRKMGFPEKAREDWERAMEIGPRPKERAFLQASLSELKGAGE